MKKELIALYKELLFNVPQTTPSLKTYAIVDSIRDEKVKEKILFSNLNHTDLWHEELFENEIEVPLYLVELEKENELLDYLLAQHTKSIATYFISPYSLETLQAYYNKFTHVNLEIETDDFKKALFGFYDPNTLPNYMQTLYTPEKVDEFFAGVGIWLSPSVQRETELYIAFRDKEGEVDDVSIELTSLLKEENPSFNFDNASLPTVPNLEAYAHEVNIDQRQLQLFNDAHKIRFINKAFVQMQDDAYNFYYDETVNKKRAFELFDEAKSMGIESEDGVYKYIVLGLLTLIPLNQTQIYEKLLSVSDEKMKLELLNKNLWNIIEQQRRETDG
jgi:hypothetical protein